MGNLYDQAAFVVGHGVLAIVLCGIALAGTYLLWQSTVIAFAYAQCTSVARRKHPDHKCWTGPAKNTRLLWVRIFCAIWGARALSIAGGISYGPLTCIDARGFLPRWRVKGVETRKDRRQSQAVERLIAEHFSENDRCAIEEQWNILLGPAAPDADDVEPQSFEAGQEAEQCLDERWNQLLDAAHDGDPLASRVANFFIRHNPAHFGTVFRLHSQLDGRYQPLWHHKHR